MTEFNYTEYHVDSADTLIFVDAQWDVFARNNESPQVLRQHVINRPLFSFLTHREVVYVYHLLITKVRAEQTQIRFRYRCDSPTHKRFMVMEMHPLMDNQVRFVSRLDWQIPNDHLQILDIKRKRHQQVITMCSWCKKIRVAEKTWSEIDVAVEVLELFDKATLPRISHGVCPECYTAVMEEYELERYAGATF